MNIHVYVSVSNSLIYGSRKLSNFLGFFVNIRAIEGDVRLCFLNIYNKAIEGDVKLCFLKILYND